MQRENNNMVSRYSGEENRSTSIRDMNWSPSEKRLARQAFDRALQREFEAVIRETKRLAAEIQQPEELWELERYLGDRRKEIDSRFDYRYSVLPFVFADLIRTGRLQEEELHGLSEEKLEHIRDLALD
jgi:hypothetical protein